MIYDLRIIQQTLTVNALLLPFMRLLYKGIHLFLIILNLLNLYPYYIYHALTILKSCYITVYWNVIQQFVNGVVRTLMRLHKYQSHLNKQNPLKKPSHINSDK